MGIFFIISGLKKHSKGKMKKKFIIFSILFLILILTIFIFANPNQRTIKKDLGEIHENTTLQPKKAGYYTPSFIHIDEIDPNNWSNTASTYGWCYEKDGVYYIENCTIDGSSSPLGTSIFINNSRNTEFVIRNCTVFDSSTPSLSDGIKLENSTNGKIIANNCSNNNYGIFLNLNCDNNALLHNLLINNDHTGILLDNQCDSNRLENNLAINNGSIVQNIGISLMNDCFNNTIKNNTANNNDFQGIFLLNNCDNNTIIYNTASNVGALDQNRGIYLSNTCENNTIIGNNVSYNYHDGIFLSNYCSNNTILKNYATNNQENGILLISYCGNNTISNNTVGNKDSINQKNAISLYGNCHENIISCNEIINNTVSGLILRNSSNNRIRINNIFNNTNNGVDIQEDCVNNSLESNIIQDNRKTGIYLENNCNNNSFFNNQIFDNLKYGVIIENETTPCSHNRFRGNFFNNPSGINALDNCSNNYWDGNWWHDYQGADENDDGVGDTPHEIPGSGDAQDNNPIWDDGPDDENDENDKDETFTLSFEDYVLIFLVLTILIAITVPTVYLFFRRNLKKKAITKRFHKSKNKSLLLEIFNPERDPQKSKELDQINLTTISFALLEKVDKLDLNDNEKGEFFEELISFSTKEREEILDFVLEKSKNTSKELNDRDIGGVSE
ncbi:MAG: hypothetical protein GF383_03345 [Candidatus Lokiarchaeota archaeon]|nr:hypothetical protein [Candidatus Lokiarchaeota archaeon]MBD3338669.1 hypothetical protein [Candidatus Lokiarchaeota archaeon]